MYLEGKVQTARVSQFHDGLEVSVLDKAVEKRTGGRPQYNCKITRGWPLVEEMRLMKRAVEKKTATDQDLEQLAGQIVLPQEDQVLPLIVVEINGKGGFKTLMCEIAVAP